jgi:hypothetical protein
MPRDLPSVRAVVPGHVAQHRSTQRKVPRGRDDEQRLTADIIELARQYGRYGYRKVAELLDGVFKFPFVTIETE